jgi:tetratricopeptide (TPR) repeat protein
MALELAQPVIDFLVTTVAETDFYQGIFGNLAYDAGKKMGGLTSNVVSKVFRKSLLQEETTGKIPLNHDLYRGIRHAYLSASINLLTDLKLRFPQYSHTIDHIIEVFSEEQKEIYKENYVLGNSINTPNIAYSEVYKIHPAFEGDRSQLKADLETDLRRELKQRFDDEEHGEALEKLRSEIRDTTLFNQLQNYFLKEYKDRDLIQAAFDGAMLVQLASREERELEALKTLPEETQQRVSELLEAFQKQLAPHNQEIARILKDYFNERTSLILIAIKKLESSLKSHQASEADRVIARIDQLESKPDFPAAKRIAGIKTSARLEHFTDRNQQRHDLKQLVTQNQYKLIQICGPSGVGKTTLITKLFTELEDEVAIKAFVYVTKQDISTLGLNGLFSPLAETLSPEKRHTWEQQRKESESNPENQSHKLLNLLDEQRTLLFIDNFEDFLDESNAIKNKDIASFVYTLLSSAANTSITLFITSQRAIKLPNDLMAQSHNRICEYPPRHGLQGLPEDDALKLFYALDSDRNEGIHSTPEPKLKELIKRCDANPRVLETIVGYLRNMGQLYELSDLLADEQELLNILQDPAKALYNSQPDELKGLLETLAIYGKPVPIEALNKLREQNTIELRKNLSRLDRSYALLYNKENKTFSLRAADQHYIYQQIAEASHQHKQASGYYREIRKPQENWKLIEDLQANLDEFEQLIKAQDYDAACRVLTDIDFNYLLLWGYVRETCDLHLQLLNKVQDRTLKSIHLGNLGLAYSDLGEVRKAIDYYEQALKIAREIKDKEGEAINLGNLGEGYHALGEFRKAIKYHEQALLISRELQHKRKESASLGNLGSVYRTLGEVRKAIEHYEQALEISREIQDRRGEGTDLGNLGNAYSDLGEVRKAIEYYEQSLVIDREIQNPLGEGMALFNIALINDDLKSKLTCMVRAWFLFATIGSPLQQNVLKALKHYQTEQTDFETLLRSLFPTGDSTLNAASKQNYTFFRDAPPNLPDQILQALAELETE